MMNNNTSNSLSPKENVMLKWGNEWNWTQNSREDRWPWVQFEINKYECIFQRQKQLQTPANFLLCLALIYKLLANEDAIEQSKAWFHSHYKANSEYDA